MSMKKKICALLLAAVACLGLAACGGSNGEDVGGTALTIAITNDENTLAPFTYVSSTGLTVNRLIYDTLFTTDLENNLVPWMVEEDYTVENSQVFTFRLVEGQTFHNGEPVDAEAVRFSFTYPATQVNSTQRRIWSGSSGGCARKALGLSRSQVAQLSTWGRNVSSAATVAP